jgi:hypothetical protein
MTLAAAGTKLGLVRSSPHSARAGCEKRTRAGRELDERSKALAQLPPEDPERMARKGY